MDWSYFIYFAAPALFCWIGGAWLAYRPSFSKGAVAWTVFGLAIFSAFIIGMWISLERPPLRTMGETRLWYSFFLPVAGVITYVRWRYKWILSFSTLLAFVFICVNLFKPEIHNKTLMPALQSPWFAPHVIVYMFSYAMLGAAALIAIYLLIRARKKGIDEVYAITWYMSVWPFSRLGCCSALYGPRRRGGIIGIGTRRRHGRLPLGWDT